MFKKEKESLSKTIELLKIDLENVNHSSTTTINITVYL
jgi:hypothetical protein